MTSQVTTTYPRDHESPFREELPVRIRQVKAIAIGDEPSEYTTCTEQTHVIFIKVHKAGSSTVSNILQRFGTFRKLNFVLPKKTLHVERYNYIGEPGGSVANDNIILVPQGQHYNILCNHVTYNRTAFTRLFPAKRFFYLSIIRTPLDHFLSVIRYYGYSNFSYIQTILSIKSGNPLSEYLKSPEDYEPYTPYISYTNNRQSVDLGLPIDVLGNVSAIHAYVDTIRRDFDFIMLLEYFDESLIYLKRKLCWSYKDILYYPKNSRWNNNKYALSVLDLARLRTWNSADYILYEELHSEFWRKIQNAGADFYDEVLHFKRITEAVRLYCANADVTSDLEIKGSRWEADFTVTTVDCQMLGLGELQFLDKIYFENYGIVKNRSG
ncbi:galactosylceramide sulfotransferase-like [Mizuhopecten yessoensis]|uniref:Galactosylceramide sulfotransferase n=1 Tax=Mizuhopecten yessoensis TaxID=6573 RepID=A0A210QBU6_MIZYE|nr:galactosylceramide sulfotransferase-like [Mizuhopecten yessoensis]OWF46198.1 Galactosylceramide sulfotransferase [Mizuhopecten yessoensis]